MCLRNKVLKTRGYVRNFTYLDAANITSKQKFDMTKVAIKNGNITSLGGIIILWTFSQSWALKDKEDKEGKQQTDTFGVIYTYRCILTNNRTSTEKDIITSRKTSLIFIMSVEQAKRTSIYRTMTSDGHICPFPLWLRTWFS